MEKIAERRVKALELRKDGKSYRAIAKLLGVDLRTAFDDVQAELRALREQATDAAEQVKDLELARCDEMTEALSSKVGKGDTQAIQANIRVMERRAKLLGIDAPTKTQGTVAVFDANKVSQVPDSELQVLMENARKAAALLL